MPRPPKLQCESGRTARGSSRPRLRAPASGAHPSRRGRRSVRLTGSRHVARPRGDNDGPLGPATAAAARRRLVWQASVAAILVVAADPDLGPIGLVAAFWHPVEDRGETPQGLRTAGGAGGAVVDGVAPPRQRPARGSRRGITVDARPART